MPRCLLGLGSNLGDREAMLAAALAAIDALPDVQLRKQSDWIGTQPVGGPEGQGEFLNGAALVDTTTAPLILLKELQQIEARLGRTPGPRWAARAIDIDILLYDRQVMEQEMIALPHPRMTYRRFVLQPACQIAAKMIHPIIGWPIERLLMHLDRASDLAAIVSPADERRGAVATRLADASVAGVVDAPALGEAVRHWPAEWTTWLQVKRATASVAAAGGPASLAYAAAMFPKLSILIDPPPASPPATHSRWATLVRQPGRGPTLRIPHGNDATLPAEIDAAVGCVWPTGPI